jgi:hypothetical protein
MKAKRRTGGRVLALRAWTVKKAENGKFFISPTACFHDKLGGTGRTRRCIRNDV